MKAMYQPIKRGMTEAVTRGELEAAEREGREPVANAKQLAWFDIKDGEYCVFGVLDGIIYSWLADGKAHRQWENHPNDLFALPLYEWQWNMIDPNGIYQSTTVHLETEEDAKVFLPTNGWRVERIEGSKRLVAK